ncbi:MAG: MBOAT family O-acyltransferase [Chitinophagaceae bacterium]|nr:MBOAT family protein [Bacteroidota bacterium]MBK9505474.1 MBOAT family protein [Bacteroidota bacterium]MBK9556173.1 MBOAT family protein [Bacteroidota bacterium]MBL0278746.1 MBOAT family protein [Bacteroidota bacterium]MBP9879898.1 MBOAT family protein [Chitinophagales bacterium]
MSFNSYIYILFLPLVLTVYYMTGNKYRWIVLLVASYLFYMMYEVAYGLILLTSTTICWVIARQIHITKEKNKRKQLLTIGIIADAGILFVFKYFGFFASIVESFNNPEALMHAPQTILLPIGISFYTFKSLGYIIDVYRKVTKPEPHFGYFALYVSFFPQLIAGPIERANELIPQLHQTKKLGYDDLQYGLSRMAWGFFKKLVVADTVAGFVNFTFSDISGATGAQLYITLLFFAVQLYADFSGYCDIAIGTARLFGIRLSENFNQPYIATSISDYWNRWHITLTTWIRDYIFTPLNKGVTTYWRIYLNTLIVFILIGLWHGASINFVVFGLINGIIAVLQAIYKRVSFLPKFKSVYGKIFLIVWNFHLLILSGVVFRAKSFTDARLYYQKLFSGFSVELQQILNGFAAYEFAICLAVALIFVASFWLPKNFRFKYSYAFILIVTGMVILLGRNNAETFIYFQF